MTSLDATTEKLEGISKQWQDFDDRNKALNDWLKSMEVRLRSQPLQSTLEEKLAQLDKINSDKNEIAAKEKEIDAFVDKSHALVQKSGVQRIKPLISQITTRYHNLLALCRDTINRWQEVVDNHKKYEEKLDETSSWLAPLEEHLKTLQSGELANNIQAINNKLQILLTEKEQGEHKINSLTLLGEQLLPHTEAKGREIIRNTLRSIRERWEALEEGKLPN